MERVVVERVIPHPIEAVFDRFTDNEGWSSWAGFGPVKLSRTGEGHRDGKGAVRSFSLVPRLREEITLLDRPRRQEYRIIQGAYPVADHHGEVSFTEEPGGTRVIWQITFRSRLPLLGRPLAGGITLVFRHILRSLERDLDARRS